MELLVSILFLKWIYILRKSNLLIGSVEEPDMIHGVVYEILLHNSADFSWVFYIAKVFMIELGDFHLCTS